MAGVNVKMGVTGVSQFKQSMTQAKNSVKTLDQALQLNEKQFKATGDAQEYSQKKAELLKEKLAEQTKIVEQAEAALKTMTANGVDKASSAFQSMQQQLLKAKGDVIDTTNSLNGIDSAAVDASNGVAEMNSELSNIGTQVSFKTVTDGISSITSGLEGAIKKAWSLGTALVQNVLGAGTWADDLATRAAQYSGLDPDMTPEKLQRMEKTSQLIDTSVDAIINSKQKLSTAMGKSDIDDIFAEFGIHNTRYGELEDLDDLFWDVGEALMSVDNEAKRAQMGKKLFGNWTELIPLFTAGREEYEATMEAQSVVSDEALEKLLAMDDQYQKLQGEIETLKMEFLSELSPATTETMETLTGLVREFNEYIQSEDGKAMMKALSDAVTGLFSDISKIDPEQALAGLTGVIESLKGAFEWVTTNSGTVVGAMETIVGGWAALKLTGGALQLLELVNGLRGLGGSKITLPTVTGGGNGGGSDTANVVGGGLLGKVGNFLTSAGAKALGGAGAFLATLFANYTNGHAVGEASEIGPDDGTGIRPIVELTEEDIRRRWLKELESGPRADLSGTGEIIHKERTHGKGTIQEQVQESMEEADAKERAAIEDLFHSWRNFETGADTEAEYDNAYNYFVETLGDKAGAVMEALIEQMDSDPKWMNKDNVPDSWWASIEEALNGAEEDLLEVEDEVYTMGGNVSIGLANGINDNAHYAIDAAESLADEIEYIISSALDINSPSKVMEKLGGFVAAGFAEGIEGGTGRVSEAMYAMAQTAYGTTASTPISGGSGSRTVNVTLMIDSEKLTEAVVPLTNSSLGEQLSLSRR